MLRALILLIALAPPALAHPHVFIDASVTATVDDQNRLTGFRIRWDYDDYVSLILATDKNADLDGDGFLTDSELTPLQGFDMAWSDEFDGDTTLWQGDQPLALQAGPLDWKTGWQDLHLWSEHGRQPLAAVDLTQGPVVIVIRDVTDYTAYTLAKVSLTSAPVGCEIKILTPEDEADCEGFGGLLGTLIFGSDEAAPAQITADQKVLISCDP